MAVEKEQLKKAVLDVIRQHNLPIGDDDPVTELAVLHTILFDQHIEAVSDCLTDHAGKIVQSSDALTDRFNHLFSAFIHRLKGIQLKARLPRAERGLLLLTVTLSLLNSIGLLFVIGKILGWF